MSLKKEEFYQISTLSDKVTRLILLLILSGSLEVQIDGKKVGKMESGEIFGELSLILGENRKASIKAISPSEIIEINKTALEAILLSSNMGYIK